jgi:phosphoglycerate dehydrogenase-like enzyme
MNSGVNTKPIVLITEGSDAGPLDWLKERANVVEVGFDSPGFDAQLAVAQGMVVRTYTRVNQDLLAKAPNLKVVGRGGVGIENIDVKACRARGVEVVYTPDANTIAVGDYVFGNLLQLVRPYAHFRDRVYTPKEFKQIRNTHRGRQLDTMTMGIIGLGRVGKRVASIARAFGMNVVFNDLLDMPGHQTAMSKHDLLRQCDVLSLHVDMRSGNENMIGANELAMLKDGAIVINTCRGEVLDVHALASELKSGRLGGCVIDVFSPEPPAEDFPLLGLQNALLTPHMAARTTTAIANMSWVVKDVWGVLQGEPAKFPAP